MVSQRSLLSAPRLLTIFLASFSVISSVNGVAQSEDDSQTINGITITEADQAPDCMYECPALEKYGSGSELPQCVTEQLTDNSQYADMIKSGDYGSDDETLQAINEIMSCICTDVDFVKELADCVFNEPCGNNNTAIYEAISIGYKVCGVMYNVTYPAPTEVVKMLQISVPSGVVVPTTITGVPQATTWPGKTVDATLSSTTSNPSATATSSSSSSNSNDTVTASTNAAMKSSPSYYLVFLAFFAFLAVSVSAQSNGTNPISSTTTGIAATTTTIANGTLTSTSTVAVTSGVSNGTLTSTSTATNNLTTSTTSTRTSSTGTSSTTTGSSASASSTDDAPGAAIKNGASFGLVAAGAVAAAFLF
ncbi:hypothetical protein P167DRAFT_575206 [Morchella conica CCBAS932]|uniref:Extracellular membrane protein CFEM domain-containing protein n=1 Tax=Morchella conica CCBAS932 TaxID=1392247 RepID=A0A3N4KQ67_9PEZI|nr:hypothetical protein P167DRAFT_575206 [Morchella conica CCBAS932]